jgi:VCBS repeat-containing protein
MSGRVDDTTLLPANGITHFVFSASRRYVRLEPADNESGESVVTLTVTDGDGESTSKAFTLTVNSQNDPPTISDIPNQTTDEDVTKGPISFTIGDVETANLDSLQVTATSSNATVVPNDSTNIILGGSGADRTITLKPADDEYGFTYITVTVTDPGGLSASDTFLLSVLSVNDAPTGGDASVTTNEDVTYTFHVNNFPFDDIEGSVLQKVRIDTAPTLGRLLLNSTEFGPGDEVSRIDILNSRFKYEPASDDHGAVTFTFSVSDGSLWSDESSTMTVNITPDNDLPTITSVPNQWTDEDTPLSLVFTIGDVETPVESLDVTATSLITTVVPSDDEHLAITVDANLSQDNMSLVITPEADASGVTRITIRVTDEDDDWTETTFSVTVVAINDPPTSGNNTVTANEDQYYYFKLADFPFNDVDSPAGLNRVRIDSLPENGKLYRYGQPISSAPLVVYRNDVTTNNFRFLADPNDYGTAYTDFEFTVSDGQDYAASPSTMTVDVAPQNDPPTGGSSTITTLEDTPYTFVVDDFPFTDIDEGDEFEGIRTFGTPAKGDLKLDGESVGAVQAISREDIADGKLIYHPALNGNGSPYTYIPYQVFDGDAYSTTNNVSVNVTPVNDPPTVVDDSFTVNEDASLSIFGSGVLINDSDPEGDAFTAVLIRRPFHGTVDLAPNGSFVYVPDADYSGDDSFTYAGSDGHGADSVEATVSISVTAVNDAPVGEAATFEVASGGTLRDAVPMHDTDFTTLTAEIVNDVGNGELQWRNGLFSYSPDDGFLGTDSFTYRVKDHSGVWTSPAEITINVVEPVVSVSIEAVDPFGNPAEAASVGDKLNLNVYVEDNRIDALGVWKAYVDLTFDSEMAHVLAPKFAGPFKQNTNADRSRHGVVNDTGGVLNDANGALAGQYDDRQLLFRLPIIVEDSGSLTFTSRPAARNDDYGVFVFGSDDPVLSSSIAFDELTIDVAPISPWQNPVYRFDVTDDGLVTVDDFFVVKNYLTVHSPGPLPNVADAYPYYDINGDFQATDEDLQLIADFLGVDPEGEQNGEDDSGGFEFTESQKTVEKTYPLEAGDRVALVIDSADGVEELNATLLGPGEGYSVSYAQQGEWLEVRATISTSGDYTIRVANFAPVDAGDVILGWVSCTEADGTDCGEAPPPDGGETPPEDPEVPPEDPPQGGGGNGPPVSVPTVVVDPPVTTPRTNPPETTTRPPRTASSCWRPVTIEPPDEPFREALVNSQYQQHGFPFFVVTVHGHIEMGCEITVEYEVLTEGLVINGQDRNDYNWTTPPVPVTSNHLDIDFDLGTFDFQQGKTFGQVTFGASGNSHSFAEIHVPIRDDSHDEPTEDFELRLIKATFGPSTEMISGAATGYIIDDDEPGGDAWEVTTNLNAATTTYSPPLATFDNVTSPEPHFIYCGPQYDDIARVLLHKPAKDYFTASGPGESLAINLGGEAQYLVDYTIVDVHTSLWGTQPVTSTGYTVDLADPDNPQLIISGVSGPVWIDVLAVADGIEPETAYEQISESNGTAGCRVST